MSYVCSICVLCPGNMALPYSKAAARGAQQKKRILKNFAKFTEKHVCQSVFFNKIIYLYQKRESGTGAFL